YRSGHAAGQGTCRGRGRKVVTAMARIRACRLCEWRPEGGLEFVGGKPGARGSFESPSWSPDGMHVVFHRETATEWPPLREEHSRDPAFRLIRTGIFPSYSLDGLG